MSACCPCVWAAFRQCRAFYLHLASSCAPVLAVMLFRCVCSDSHFCPPTPHISALFSSDIRSAETQTMREEETETHIRDDMESQKRWVEILKPRLSMLKFRLSWKPGKTTYLAGDIHLPVWGPITTTESRLGEVGSFCSPLLAFALFACVSLLTRLDHGHSNGSASVLHTKSILLCLCLFFPCYTRSFAST